MPLYMDIHEVAGVTAQAVAEAHRADVETQGQYDVTYHKYWLNEEQGKIFCLCTAPNADAAALVHQKAHGLTAQKIIEVAPEIAEGFLGGCVVDANGAVLSSTSAGRERDSGIRTIMFTDLVDSTMLTQQLGDDAAMNLLRIHDRVVREALGARGGREVKHTGDGIMASFASAAAAVRCATEIQNALDERARASGDTTVTVRIGAAAGEPVESNRDLFGTTVQLASRLCSHAEPKQCLVSNVVAELCAGKDLAFRDLGEVHLKGFETPIRIHAIHPTPAPLSS
ncbi:MAG TPA: nickel-binding protein [Candidatus Tumulicola sp.]|jgi:class 3 adenylate cyclase